MYWAHKNGEIEQLLLEHLQTVGSGCRAAVSELVNFEGITAEQFKEYAELCGRFHDLGKYTDFFQDYLLEGKNLPDKDHAPISAWFLYNLLNNIETDTGQFTKISHFLCYLAVRLHHGNLQVHGLNMDPRDLKRNLQNKSVNLLHNAEKILREFPVEYDLPKFQNLLSMDHNDLQAICDIPHFLKSPRLKNAQWFFYLSLLFSLLIDQDKLDSAQIASRISRQIEPG